MAKMVHDHPDGYIMVRDEQIFYADIRENLNRDFGVTFPPLPEGAIERIYIQGVRHTIQAEADVIGGGEMPWPLGDSLISSVQAGLNARLQREGPPPPQPKLQEASPELKALQERYRFPRMAGT